MAIQITEKTIGMWSVQLTADSDFLMAVTEAEEGYVLDYRFRYYEDGNFGPSSKDRKNWYKGLMRAAHTPSSRIAAIERARQTVQHIREVAREVKGPLPTGERKVWEVLMDPEKGLEDFFDRLVKLPNVHICPPE